MATDKRRETWLVAHDLSPMADAAANEAARLLAPHNGHLRFVHVHAPVGVTPEQSWGDATFEVEKELRAKLEKIAIGLHAKHPSLEVTVEVVPGEPIKGILDEADRQGADHIVVGTRGRTGVAHLVLGSVAEAVARRAKVPVFIVRTQDKA